MDRDASRSTGNADPRDMEPGLSPERVERLLANLSTLQSNRRHLLQSIRASLVELRSLRSSLEERRAKNGSAPGALQPPLNVQLQQHYRLTPRETEVAILLARGASNLTIASTLGISPHTARHHTQAVLTKFGARSRAEAGAKVRG
jgi:DNA-binding NarL/FixJ family response regulator